MAIIKAEANMYNNKSVKVSAVTVIKRQYINARIEIKILYFK